MTAAVHQRVVGDTLTPIDRILRSGPNCDPIDLSNYTPKFLIEEEDGTSFQAETITGLTAHPTQTFTVDTSEYWIKAVAHGAMDGDQIVVSSTTTLPTGLAASTRYFVRDVGPNAFKVSLTPNGSVVSITGAGSGTHSFYVVGFIRIATAALAFSAKHYRLWYRLYSSSNYREIPDDEYGVPIHVKPQGN